ncbi:OLC1v1022438C2 [Oldenlandia corymbosa var. corymbosa]|uniref:OLC1v1022438C2 n=1 Tax=Oldenlandia corymbosa var. corymbosa TaxID=529605 RepID=A0AAV1C088_OLDCO|nr:OLC1v1022438C2 [Oldenlandia corymbosa var. corymbosa]
MAFLEGNGRRMKDNCGGNGGAGDDDWCYEDENALLNYPVKVRTTLRYIKEISQKHSYEDIYSMLRECGMDPNETVQKLLLVDPFREVKHKHSKRRSNVDPGTSERRKWMSGVQQREAGAGRGNNYSAYSPIDGGGHRRQAPVRPENGGPYHREPNHAVPLAKPPSVAASNGNSINEPSQGASIAEVRQLGKSPALQTVAVKQLDSTSRGPTPASTPTTASIVSSGTRFVGEISESQSTDLPASLSSAPVSGVYSSASDPVLLPSLNLRNLGAAGTIKREKQNPQCASEFSGPSCQIELNGGHVSTSGSQEGVRTANGTSQRVEKSKTSEHSRDSSLLSHDNPSSAAIVEQDDWSLEQVSGPSQVLAQVGNEAQGASMQSHSKLSDPVLEKEISQLDMKLEGLKLSTHQQVIFPDHIQVPEEVRVGLTFGSLDGASVPSKNMNKDSTRVAPSVMIGQDAAGEPPLCDQPAAPAVEGDDSACHTQTQPEGMENLSPLEMDALSAAVPPKSNQLKPDILPHIGGSQYPFLSAAPVNGFSIVPPIFGHHLLQVEAAEVASSVPSTSSSSQPAQPVGTGQNSVAVSPQLFPFLRHPFPSNYVPYNPYFPHLYMPHGSHQFIGHGGFPQLAPTGNMYMPPAAATGVKYPVSPVYKPGANTGNPANFGIPSGYGPYGSSAVGYGIGASITPSGSSCSEDLAAPETKDRNIYSALNQNEEPQIWTSVPARDMSSLPGNFYYNFPPGQQVAFPPSHSGQGSIAEMYHLTQTADAAASTSAQSPPEQQSQPIAGSAEPEIPPSGGTYQQTHSQNHWNTKLLNR